MVNTLKKWRKVVVWTTVAMTGLSMLATFAGVLLLQHSKGFRQDILAKVESSLQESTGARVEVDDFNVQMTGLSLDLYNVVVHGKEDAQGQPLLQVDHIRAGLTIDSILRRRWHVRNIIIDHPVVRLAVDQAGHNNLPTPPSKSTSSNSSVFDLAIRELKLERGEIYYNDQKSPLNAEVHDLSVHANYSPAQNKYSGTLGYNAGKVIYGQYAPVEHDTRVAFSVTPEKLVLDRLELKAGRSNVIVRGSLTNYASTQPEAEGSYEGAFAISDFQRILKDPSLPEGTVQIAGVVSYRPNTNRPMLDTVSVNGTVSSSGLAVKTPRLQTEVRELHARYVLSHGNAEVKDIRARVLGGVLTGHLTIRDVAGAHAAQLRASIKGLSFDQLEKDLRNVQVRQVHLSGTINASADARWSKTLDSLVAQADATIQANIRQGAGVPVDGAIHAVYDAKQKQVALTRSYIRTPQTTLNLNGTVSKRSQMEVALRSQDLHEFELLATALARPAPGKEPEPLGLRGRINLKATIRGEVDAPQINGHVEAADIRLKGSVWKTLRADFNANPGYASLSNGTLEAAPQGRIKFSGRAELRNWAYRSSLPLTAELSATQISITDLERLTNKTYPVTGTLALNVSVHGTQMNPVGQGTLTVTGAKISNEPIQNVNLKFHGNGEAVVANISVRMAAGTATADVTYWPRNERYQAQLQAHNIRLEKLQTVKTRNAQLAGAININASGSGTIKDPQLHATLEVPELLFHKQTMQGIKLETTVQNHVATLSLDSEVAQTAIKAHGTVGIEAPYLADVSLDTGRIDFRTLAALFASAQAADVSGTSEVHARIRGPLADKDRVEAHLEVPTLTFAYKQFQLGTTKPIRADYQKGAVVLQPASIRGTGTTIDAQATIPLDSIKTASFLVQGTVDLHIAQLFVSDLQSNGQLHFDLDSRKYSADDGLNGHIKIVNASLHTSDSPIGLDNVNGVVNVTQTKLEIASLQGQAGGGTIAATGAVVYRPTIDFQLALAANNIRVRYPDGVRAILASNLALRGSLQQSLVSGLVKIERVSFTPDFDLSTFTDQFTGEAGNGGTPGSFTQGMKLNIAVQSTSQMNLVSSQVSLRGDANLRMAGTAAAPVILGRTTLSGGEFFIAGNRYEVQQGTIDFLNPVHTEPVVNLQVRTTINDYNITLGLRGPLERLETTYTSDPALPPVDIINLIARGKTSEQQAANPAPSGVLGAQAALASTVSSQVTGQIAKLAGVSQLQIDPGLGTDSGQNPGARIAIQQRVTSSLLVTFATDIASAGRQAIQIEYKFNPRWSVSGTRNQNGGFGVDGKYRKDF